MAEKGAHLTGTAYAVPSIFEIVAQDSLARLLEPAIEKCITFLVSCSPGRYGWLLRWSDEMFLVLNATLQTYYLKNYSASFSETLYGLRRVSAANPSVTKRLSSKQQSLSLLLIVLFPYLRGKISKLCNKYRLAEVDGKIPEERWKRFLMKCVVKGYITFHTIGEFAVLYQYLLYISGWSSYPTPTLWLTSATLTYADIQKILTVSELLGKIRQGTFSVTNGIDLFERITTRSLELGAFVLQFFQWWNQEYHTSLITLPVPPPPPIPETAKRYAKLCPICYRAWHIPTALATSGYIFCYKCILHAIQKHGRCPITNYPVKEDDLVRLYID